MTKSKQNSQDLSQLGLMKPVQANASTLNLAISQVESAMVLLWGELPEGMKETPSRVVKYWVEMSQGININPSESLSKVFDCDYDQVVIEKGIPFTSLCEHHLLPFYGVAHIGYIPDKKVVGLSKLPRALEVLATRPQIQERLTEQLGDLIFNVLECKGVVVILEAEHNCMSCRGVKKHGVKTITSCLRGVFMTDSSARAEVLSLIKG